MLGVQLCKFLDRLRILPLHEEHNAHVESELLPATFVPLAKDHHALLHYHLTPIKAEDLQVFDVLLHAQLILGELGLHRRFIDPPLLQKL